MAESDKKLDTRLINIETSVTLARASVAQHETKLNIMEEHLSESKRIRLLACNVRFVPLADVDPQFAL